MLLEGFYTVLSTTKNETGFSATIRLNKEHIIYKAHFDGNPITPGACMVQILKDLMRAQFDKDFTFNPIVNIKFLNVLKPDETTEATYNVKCHRDDKKIKANAVIVNGDKTYAKISGYFNEL